MRGLFAVVPIVGVMIVARCSKPAQLPDIAVETHPQSQVEVESTLHELLGAAEAKDLKRLASFHLYGSKFTKFDDWEPLERKDSEEGEMQGLTSLKAFRPRIEALKVDVFGPVAIATFVMRYEMETEREKVATRARSTMVFLKVDSGWKVVHEHFSAFKSNP